MLHHTNHSEFEKQKTQMVVKYLRQENPSWESWSFPEALLLFLKKKKKKLRSHRKLNLRVSCQREA